MLKSELISLPWSRLFSLAWSRLFSLAWSRLFSLPLILGRLLERDGPRTAALTKASRILNSSAKRIRHQSILRWKEHIFQALDLLGFNLQHIILRDSICNQGVVLPALFCLCRSLRLTFFSFILERVLLLIINNLKS